MLKLTNELNQLSTLGQMAGVEPVPVDERDLGVGLQTLDQQGESVHHLVRHRHRGEPGQQLGEQLVVLAARHTDGSQGWVLLPQDFRVLLVHLGGNNEN